jgi:hypothetical protein
VNDPSDVAGAMRRGGKSVVLLIERDGKTFFASLRTE